MSPAKLLSALKPKSFFFSIAAALLLLLVTLGILQGLVFAVFIRSYLDETNQLLNWSLATEIRERIQPLVRTRIDYEAVQRKLYEMSLLHPLSDVYVVDQQGQIVLRFGAVRPERKLDRIDLAPVQEFLQTKVGDRAAIYGSNPWNSSEKAVFSAAPIELLGKPGYVYVSLGGSRAEHFRQVVANSYIVRSSLFQLFAVFLIIAFLGILIFFLLSRRIKQLVTGVRAFSKGQFDKRIPVNSEDEIGQLGSAINSMADALEANIDQLRKTDQLRRELIANVAHDLRSPLGAVYGHADTLIDEQAPLDPTQVKKAHLTIYDATKDLIALVNDFFELSKLDAQDVALHPETIEPAEFLPRLSATFEQQASQAAVDLHCEVHSATPRILADRQMITRVLQNLIGNALKFTPAGGRVSVNAFADRGGVRFSIQDSGIGIPEEELPHIFDRFKRGSSDEHEATDGSGLGLAIVQKLLSAHGVKIEVVSTQGKGSTFSFVLPQARDVES